MSPQLPVLSGAEVVTILSRAGFERAGQRGSHVKLRNPDGRTVIVPLHDELARGTLSSILGKPDYLVTSSLRSAERDARQLLQARASERCLTSANNGHEQFQCPFDRASRVQSLQRISRLWDVGVSPEYV